MSYLDIHKGESRFDRAFNPALILQNYRITALYPCVKCENMHRYFDGTAIESEPVNKERCECCPELMAWETDCVEKLAWYEATDSRLRNSPKIDDGIYDCGKLIKE